MDLDLLSAGRLIPGTESLATPLREPELQRRVSAFNLSQGQP